MAVDKITKDLGPITAYAIAVREGFVGTRAEWESHIANASNNAQSAHNSANLSRGYADGKNLDGSTNAGLAESNAKYYSELAEECANRAEYSAANVGYMQFHINSRGELIYEHTLNVGLTFELRDGELIMVCPAQ